MATIIIGEKETLEERLRNLIVYRDAELGMKGTDSYSPSYVSDLCDSIERAVKRLEILNGQSIKAGS